MRRDTGFSGLGPAGGPAPTQDWEQEKREPEAGWPPTGPPSLQSCPQSGKQGEGLRNEEIMPSKAANRSSKAARRGGGHTHILLILGPTSAWHLWGCVDGGRQAGAWSPVLPLGSRDPRWGGQDLSWVFWWPTG